jgi:hypothetical protein
MRRASLPVINATTLSDTETLNKFKKDSKRLTAQNIEEIINQILSLRHQGPQDPFQKTPLQRYKLDYISLSNCGVTKE